MIIFFVDFENRVGEKGLFIGLEYLILIATSFSETKLSHYVL